MMIRRGEQMYTSFPSLSKHTLHCQEHSPQSCNAMPSIKTRGVSGIMPLFKGERERERGYDGKERGQQEHSFLINQLINQTTGTNLAKTTWPPSFIDRQSSQSFFIHHYPVPPHQGNTLPSQWHSLSCPVYHTPLTPHHHPSTTIHAHHHCRHHRHQMG